MKKRRRKKKREKRYKGTNLFSFSPSVLFPSRNHGEEVHHQEWEGLESHRPAPWGFPLFFSIFIGLFLSLFLSFSFVGCNHGGAHCNCPWRIPSIQSVNFKVYCECSITGTKEKRQQIFARNHDRKIPFWFWHEPCQRDPCHSESVMTNPIAQPINSANLWDWLLGSAAVWLLEHFALSKPCLKSIPSCTFGKNLSAGKMMRQREKERVCTSFGFSFCASCCWRFHSFLALNV